MDTIGGGRNGMDAGPSTDYVVCMRFSYSRILIASTMVALGARGAIAQLGVAPERPDTLWLLAPDRARDAVHATDTEAALIRRYGRANVTHDSLPGAEGESSYGTVLFARDSARRLYVYWADEHFRRVEAVRPAPGATAWVVWPGLAIGSTLADAERLNGRSFQLNGFEFDYGGLVMDWRGGRLAALWSDRVAGHVGVGFVARRGTRGVSGDRVFSSALPAMRRADPRVADLYVTPR